MRKFLTRTAAALVASAAAFTPLVAKTPAPAKPAMWVLSDVDTTIYLFGTIHLLPKGTQWRTPTFDKAATSASDLVVETMIDEANPASAAAVMMKLAVNPNLPPLLDRVPADKRAALAGVVAQSGVPMAVLDKLETWAGAFILLGVTMKSLGLDPGSGVEHSLKSEFVAAKKPVGQLETNAEQFGFFDTLPEKDQRLMLDRVLRNADANRQQFVAVLAAWLRGDPDAVITNESDNILASPVIRDALLDGRNRNWAVKIAKLVDRGDNAFVAVGAAHMAGKGGVPTLLQTIGYKVERVQ